LGCAKRMSKMVWARDAERRQAVGAHGWFHSYSTRFGERAEEKQKLVGVRHRLDRLDCHWNYLDMEAQVEREEPISTLRKEGKKED